MTPLIRRYVENRLFEWIMAAAMIWLGFQIIILPRTLEAPSFILLIQFLPKLSINFFLIFFGVLRVAALIANGRSAIYGPYGRAVGAIAGAILWAQFDISIIYSLGNHIPPPPAAAFWFSFIFGELYSAYRAAGDVRNRSA
jgi:hypothetical protein